MLRQYLNPAVVFHATAYKNVPLMKTNFQEAVKTNIIGTQLFCESAVSEAVERFVFISTDKAVEPCSIMGLSKAVYGKIVGSYRID